MTLLLFHRCCRAAPTKNRRNHGGFFKTKEVMTTVSSDHQHSLEMMRKVVFESKEEEEACESLFQALSDDERELAAQSSHAYWSNGNGSNNNNNNNNNDSTAQHNTALREIRRHYIGSKRQYDTALLKLKATCAFRQRYRIDILRSCFDDTMQKNALALQYRDMITRELANQPAVIRAGTERAVFCVARRLRKTSDVESYMIAQLYMLERALAATTNGEQIDVVLNANYDSKYAPSRDMVHALLTILQEHYQERLKRLVLLNPPFWIRALIVVMSPFVEERTRKKLVIAKCDKVLANVVAMDGDVSVQESLCFVTKQPFADVWCPYESDDDGYSSDEFSIGL